MEMMARYSLAMSHVADHYFDPNVLLAKID
jgi:hypothetical protein